MPRRRRDSGDADTAVIEEVDTSPYTGARGEIADTVGLINKRYGITTCRTGSTVPQPDRISTGSFTLDLATLGGIPVSRMTMMVGNKHSGKTSMAYKIMANAQKMYPDQTPVFLDLETTFDPVWATKMGVNVDTLPVVQPETGEAAVDIGVALAESAETSLIVIDSIAALCPTKEVNASAEDDQVALQPRLITKMLRKFTHSMVSERARGHVVTFLFINQFRMKIGFVMGDPRTVPGGKALEHYTSLELIMKNKEVAGKDGFGIDTMTHNEHSFTITKNKVNNGPRTGEFRLIRSKENEHGLSVGDVDDAATMLAYAKKMGFYAGGGSKWTLTIGEDEYVYSKVAEAVEAIYADSELRSRLRNLLIREQARTEGMPDDFLDTFVI